jgi:hypothetical protein
VIAIAISCSVENLHANKMNNPVKVSKNDLTGNLFSLDLVLSGLKVRPKPSFQNREFCFNQDPPSVPGIVEIIGHLFPIFPPDIFSITPHPYRDDRIRVEGISDQPVHFLGIVTPVHDITLRFSETVTFFQENECVSGIMYTVFRDHEPGDELLIGVDGN